jgi:hypothetical protein
MARSTGGTMAARKSKSILRTAADITRAWQQLEKEVEKHRKERADKREAYAAMTRAEFEAKLKRVHSPMIVSQGWSPSAPPGGTITYRLLLVNYDILPATNLALTVFVGNRNAIGSSDLFLSGWDTRFPTYAQRAPDGFTMGSAGYGFFTFQVAVPAGVERTGHFGNCALQKIAFLDVGTVLDRACFFFDVV